FKHTTWKKSFPFPLDFPEGLRFESGGTLESQVVNWSDEIAQQTHDLEDGLPLTEEEAIEALEISQAVRQASPAGRDRAARRAARRAPGRGVARPGVVRRLDSGLGGGPPPADRGVARVQRRFDAGGVFPPARAASRRPRRVLRTGPEVLLRVEGLRLPAHHSL